MMDMPGHAMPWYTVSMLGKRLLLSKMQGHVTVVSGNVAVPAGFAKLHL